VRELSAKDTTGNIFHISVFSRDIINIDQKVVALQSHPTSWREGRPIRLNKRTARQHDRRRDQGVSGSPQLLFEAQRLELWVATGLVGFLDWVGKETR
jgi:hypothetical protein